MTPLISYITFQAGELTCWTYMASLISNHFQLTSHLQAGGLTCLCFDIVSEYVALQAQQVISHGLISPLMDDRRNRVQASAGRAVHSCCRNGGLSW